MNAGSRIHSGDFMTSCARPPCVFLLSSAGELGELQHQLEDQPVHDVQWPQRGSPQRSEWTHWGLYIYIIQTCGNQAGTTNTLQLSFNILLTVSLSLLGRRGAFVSRWAGKVSDVWRVQEQTPRFPPDHAETVRHLGDQLQCSMGGWGTQTQKHAHAKTQKHKYTRRHRHGIMNLCLCGDWSVRLSIMTRVVGGRDTGTVSIVSSTWPPATTWLLR